MRTSEQTQRHIRKARRVAVAVLKAEPDHSTKQEIMKVSIGKHRRHRKLGVNVQNIEHVRIRDQGQVHEFFDLAIS